MGIARLGESVGSALQKMRKRAGQAVIGNQGNLIPDAAITAQGFSNIKEGLINPPFRYKPVSVA